MLTSSLPTQEINAPRAGWRGWFALAVLMLPVLLVSVDNTVLSFALPEIALSLQPTMQRTPATKPMPLIELATPTPAMAMAVPRPCRVVRVCPSMAYAITRKATG